MNKLLIGGAVAAFFIAGPAFAQSAQPAKAPHPRAADRVELRTDVAANVQKMFARLDTNKDGFITEDDLNAIQAQRAAKIEAKAKQFDASKMFDRLDSNHDGKITAAELEAARAARVNAKGAQPASAAKPAAFTKFLQRFDANKDGAVSRDEFTAESQQIHAKMEKAALQRGFGNKLIQKADANKDGKVSLAEMQAFALQHFDRADLNHDGKLTPDERKQAMQALRAQRAS